MAVSVSASTAPTLNFYSLNRVAPASSFSPLKLSASFSPVRFPWPSRVRDGKKGVTHSFRPRILPLVKAKKQTFSSFDDLLAESDKPVLVDFYATWCGPCQYMVPVLKEVGSKLKDTIQVVKIDTEKYPSVAAKYNVEALPTFIIFKDGKPYDRFEGALTANQLIERIENSLKVKQ